MRQKGLMLILGVAIVVLTACSGQAAAVDGPSAGGLGETACPQAGPDTRLLASAEHGYCLLYPQGYTTEETSESQVVLYFGSLLDISHPKVFIEVGDAVGQGAEALAEATAAELETAMPGLTVERASGLAIGYEPAFVLDNVPGQDISRQAFVVHGDQLYKLTFVPASDDAGDVYGEMETVYELVTTSFRFVD
jgi:hypothetical protein